MSQEYEYVDMNVISIKEEHEDNDCVGDAVLMSDTTLDNPNNVSQSKTIITDRIKNEYFFSEVSNNIANETNEVKDGIRMILKKGVLFCNYCHEEYRDYCGKCGMLEHILNGNSYNGANDGLPKDILEIRNSFEHFGIFALKVIPHSVKFGPFTGVCTPRNLWKVKGGKLLSGKDGIGILNWMQYINSTGDTSKQNLLAFQYKDDIYYRSTCEIQEGDELLVHFGEEYNVGLSENVEIIFNPAIVSEVKDVFACTFCCLGFSSELFLFQHKTICPYKVHENLIIEELVQCPSCRIYLERKEYLDYHITCCNGIVKSQTTTSSPHLQQTEVEGHSSILKEHKILPQILHKCDLCNYKTSCKSDISAHVDKHYEVKMYGCDICRSRFKTEDLLKLHATNAHVNIEEENSATDHSLENAKPIGVKSHRSSGDNEKRFACSKCDYKTMHRRNLQAHAVSKHLAEAEYNCTECGYKAVFESQIKRHIKRKHLKACIFQCSECPYKTSYKSSLDTHVRLKHTSEKKFECTECEYKSNCKSLLNNHVKARHVSEKDYKCVDCPYTTSYKSVLLSHIIARHTNVRRYKCADCEYKTTSRTLLNIHAKAKHTSEKDYKCSECEYETSYRSSFQRHITTQHLKEGCFKCPECDFKTSCNSLLKIHIKGKHTDEKQYSCELCHFKTSYRTSLKHHTKAKHLLKCDYKCTECTYETSFKASLEKHIKARHRKEKGFKCGECEYETSQKSNLQTHIRAKHLKECDYQCSECEYKTSYKWCLTGHIKTKHLKEYDYKCPECSYGTSCKSYFEIHMKRKHPVEKD